MNNINLTNPDNPDPSLRPRPKNDWDHKEGVINELVKRGVPLRCAEIASIDLRHLFIIAYKNKLPVDKTANMLFDEVKKHCTNKDGKWRYS